MVATIEALIKLLVKKNPKEYKETCVFGTINPVGRDEFTAAGQKDYKASTMVEIWGFEYDNQTEIMIDGTYGPKSNGKIELYAGERVGKG